MSNITFIDKYKPYNIDNLILNDEFKYLLKNCINHDILNLLFIGDIGSGKTTVIQCILNQYYNNLEYKNNVLFVNNLKEQGIHSFRQEVKTFIQTSSIIKNKKKFIIVDDIDTLNEQVQQILRNAIDNYSNKINFISTCNNLQKVVDNLQSRLNIYRINLPTYDNLLYLTNTICSKENISIDTNIIDYIIKSSNNSYRILINHLQKIYFLQNKTNISINNINDICCNIKFMDFDNLLNACIDADYEQAKHIITSINYSGYSIIDIYEFFFYYIKNTTIINDKTKYKLLPIICKYISIFHTIHEDDIEIKLFVYDLMNLLKNN